MTFNEMQLAIAARDRQLVAFAAMKLTRTRHRAAGFLLLPAAITFSVRMLGRIEAENDRAGSSLTRSPRQFISGLGCEPHVPQDSGGTASRK